jgi:hypothetical protein
MKYRENGLYILFRLFYLISEGEGNMKKEDFDILFSSLKSKQQKTVRVIMDVAGQKAFDNAILENKSQDEATQIAETAAIEAGANYLKPKEATEKEIQPEKVIDWGGFTALQLEPRAKDIKAKLISEFPKDSLIKILNFGGAPRDEVIKGMRYRITATGNVLGIKRICI